ncbi:hypothetical protein BJ138DRAFT_1158587, partial [Hygrophoropsis aurantiaca]
AVGYMLGFGFFGIFIVQVFIYHARFSRDPPWLRLFVWFVAFLETLSCTFAIYGLWKGSTQHCLSCIPTGYQSVAEYNKNRDLVLNRGIQPIWSFVIVSTLTGLGEYSM